jgi:ArsR family transcriptional regulator, arsenate/arsenite/antimonite-responsive transcriptional repressor
MSTTSTTAPAPQAAATLTVQSVCPLPATAAVADRAAESLAMMFKAFADPARVKIMSLLLNTDQICACDVATAIGKTAATASNHLKLLRDAGLVPVTNGAPGSSIVPFPSASPPWGDVLSLTR